MDRTLNSGSGRMSNGGGGGRPHNDIRMDNSNVIINYLPSKITEKQLKVLFSEHGAVKSVKIVRDPVTKLMKGYGFVKFHRDEDAAHAVQFKNGFFVGDKQLKVGLARKRFDATRSCKLMITNLPQDATQEEVASLFSEFGTLIECRMAPHKQANYRGHDQMCFVLFSNPDSAERALSSGDHVIHGRILNVLNVQASGKGTGSYGATSTVAAAAPPTPQLMHSLSRSINSEDSAPGGQFMTYLPMPSHSSQGEMVDGAPHELSGEYDVCANDDSDGDYAMPTLSQQAPAQVRAQVQAPGTIPPHFLASTSTIPMYGFHRGPVGASIAVSAAAPLPVTVTVQHQPKHQQHAHVTQQAGAAAPGGTTFYNMSEGQQPRLKTTYNISAQTAANNGQTKTPQQQSQSHESTTNSAPSSALDSASAGAGAGAGADTSEGHRATTTSPHQSEVAVEYSPHATSFHEDSSGSDGDGGTDRAGDASPSNGSNSRSSSCNTNSLDGSNTDCVGSQSLEQQQQEGGGRGQEFTDNQASLNRSSKCASETEENLPQISTLGREDGTESSLSNVDEGAGTGQGSEQQQQQRFVGDSDQAADNANDRSYSHGQGDYPSQAQGYENGGGGGARAHRDNSTQMSSDASHRFGSQHQRHQQQHYSQEQQQQQQHQHQQQQQQQQPQHGQVALPESDCPPAMNYKQLRMQRRQEQRNAKKKQN